MGNINEEPFIRRQMMDKRMKKLELIDKQEPIDKKINFYGDKGAENIQRPPYSAEPAATVVFTSSDEENTTPTLRPCIATSTNASANSLR
jgi:hypothetical protein